MEKEIINKKDIIEVATEAIKNVIRDRFSGYSSPLNSVCDEVINEHRQDIKDIFDDLMSSTIKSKSFKEALREEFTHKVAKSMERCFLN